MLDFALDQYIENGSFEYLVYSTADIIVPSNFAKSLIKIKEENFCSFIWPNIHVVNGNVKNTFWPHYGIDLIIFKLSLSKAKKFKEIIKSYNQYDWGMNENFYISACDALNLKRNNLYKYSKVLKFDNDFKAFTEDRLWQIKTWNENQKYFLNFLKENKISILYAYGSYFYLLFRVFNLKDLNFSLFISYIIYYPFFLSYKIIYLIKKIFKKK